MKVETKEAAAFILGYFAAKRKRTPKSMYKHVRTAGQIFDGGAFNPLCVYEMQDAAVKLWNQAMEARS